jgi:hypothetical protein
MTSTFRAAVLVCALTFASRAMAQIIVVCKPAPSVRPDEYVTYDVWNSSWGLRDDPPDKYPLGFATYPSEAEARRAAASHIAQTKNNGAGAVTHYLIEGEPTVHKKNEGPTPLRRTTEGLQTMKEAKHAFDHAIKIEKGKEPLFQAVERRPFDTVKEFTDMLKRSADQAREAKKTIAGGVAGLTDAKFKQVNSAVNQNKRDAQDAWTRWNDAFKPTPGASIGSTPPTTTSAAGPRSATQSNAYDFRTWARIVNSGRTQSGQRSGSFGANAATGRSSTRDSNAANSGSRTREVFALDGTALSKFAGPDPRTVWFSKMKTYIESENARLQNYDRWLVGEYDKLHGQSERLTDAYIYMENQARNWRCPMGYSLQGCLNRPPVCDEARAFQSWYFGVLDDLGRQGNALERRGNELQGFREQYLAQKSKLGQSQARYQEELDRDAIASDAKPRRSPFEGLFPTTPAQKLW